MVDHNDWRVTITLADLDQVREAKDLFSGHAVAEDVQHRLGRAIAVGADDRQIFLYAGAELAAREAQRVAAEALAGHGIRAELALHRWHPAEERWEDAGVAMPRTQAEQQAEHHKLIDDETAESIATGIAQWEARAQFPSHHEAATFAERLRAEGRHVIRRWRFLVIGANNEDDAVDLAEQIRREAPPDATVRAEHSGVSLPFIPF